MRGGRDDAENMVRRGWRRGAPEPRSATTMSFIAASVSSVSAEGILAQADEAERRCDFAATAACLESARCPPHAAKLLPLVEARAWVARGEGTGMAAGGEMGSLCCEQGRDGDVGGRRRPAEVAGAWNRR